MTDPHYHHNWSTATGSCECVEQTHTPKLCDRGTVDSAAYWPEPVADLWRDVHSDEATELAKYSTVIHLRTPSDVMGFDHSNPLRTEPVQDALQTP